MLKRVKSGQSARVLSAMLLSLTAAAVPTIVASALISPALARGGDDGGQDGGRGNDNGGSRGGDDSGGRGGHGGDDGGSRGEGSNGGRNSGGGHESAGHGGRDDSGSHGGRGADDGARNHSQTAGRAAGQTRDHGQTRTRTREADGLVEAGRARRIDDAPSLRDDRGGRTNRDRRTEPGDDRRNNGS